MNSMKRLKDMTPQDEPPTHPRSEGVQYATGEEWTATINNSRKNKVTGPKWMCLVVKVKLDAVMNNIA